MRYGETKGLGGSEELACEIAIGPLGQRIEHADFWRTVLKLLRSPSGNEAGERESHR